jgi:thiol-disulfide isomerase/thioredoxin
MKKRGKNVEVIEPSDYPSCEKKARMHTGIVLVFHPGCGHCVQMRPAWELMKERVKPHVKILEVNGSEMSESPILSRSVIGKNTEGYPSIFSLRAGKFGKKFATDRTTENFVKFANESAPRTSRKTSKTLKRVKKNRKTSRKN